MTKEADRWSNFSLGGSSSFIIQRKLSLINAITVKKISRKCMGHLVVMVKQSTRDRFLPLSGFIANARWGVDVLGCVCFVLSEFITRKLHVCFLHFPAQEPFFVLSLTFPRSADISSPAPSLRAPNPCCSAPGVILAVLGLSGNPSVSPRAQPAPAMVLRSRNIFLLCWLTTGKALCIRDWRKLEFGWLGSSCWCRRAKAVLCRQAGTFWCPRKGRQLGPWHLCLPNSPWLSPCSLDRHSFHVSGHKSNSDPLGGSFPLCSQTPVPSLLQLGGNHPSSTAVLPGGSLHPLWAPKYRSSNGRQDLYLHRGKPSQLFNKLLSPHPLTTAHLIWKKPTASTLLTSILQSCNSIYPQQLWAIYPQY